jgi:hypothetical protein
MLRPEESAVLGRGMAQRVMERSESYARETGKILKSMALADAGVFAVLGFNQIRGIIYLTPVVGTYSHKPIYASDAYVCESCGAVVVDTAKHTAFHGRVVK